MPQWVVALTLPCELLEESTPLKFFECIVIFLLHSTFLSSYSFPLISDETSAYSHSCYNFALPHTQQTSNVFASCMLVRPKRLMFHLNHHPQSGIAIRNWGRTRNNHAFVYPHSLPVSSSISISIRHPLVFVACSESPRFNLATPFIFLFIVLLQFRSCLPPTTFKLQFNQL